ncbi:MAG: Ig-like domain-containing protein, partial [Alphaproteobacteria bacterium]
MKNDMTNSKFSTGDIEGIAGIEGIKGSENNADNVSGGADLSAFQHDSNHSAEIAMPEGAPSYGELLDGYYFVQSGGDLILEGKNGETFTIEGFFDAQPSPDLSFADGKILSGDFIDSVTQDRSPAQLAANTNLIDGESIAVVGHIAGDVYVMRENGTRVLLKAGDKLYEDEIIETDADGAIKMVFIDETIFSLGANARMALDEYVFDEETQSGSSALSVLKGSFLFISGKIAKTNPDDMEVVTPVATIGVRGTIVAGEVAEAEDGSMGFNISVIDGAIQVTPAGSSEPLVLSDIFATVTGSSDAQGVVSASRTVQSAAEVIGRNLQQMAALSADDVQAIENAVEASMAENSEGEAVDSGFAELVQAQLATQADAQANTDGEGNQEAPEGANTAPPPPPVNASTNGEIEGDDPFPEEPIINDNPDDPIKGGDDKKAQPIDTTAPDAPKLIINVDDSGDLDLDAPILTISGQPETRATILLTGDQGTILRYIVENITSPFVLDLSTLTPAAGSFDSLKDGESVTVSVTLTDDAGNVSEASNIAFTYDEGITAPTIAVSKMIDGSIGADAEFSGTTEVGSTVKIKVNGTEYDATVDDKGNWTLPLSTVSAKDGDTLILEVTATDASGSTATATSQAYIVDTSTAAPIINITGADGNKISGDAVIAGTAEAGATVSVIISRAGKDDITLTGITAAADGTWQLTADQMADIGLAHDETLTITATATDKFDNTKSADSVEYTVDTKTDTPKIEIAGADGGKIGDNAVIAGTSEAGATVSVTISRTGKDDVTITDITAAADGTWQLTADQMAGIGLAHDEILTITATATDKFGNEPSSSSAAVYTVDAFTAVPAFTIASAVDGKIQSDAVVTGTAEAGANVEITIIHNGKTFTVNTKAGDVGADDEGKWDVELKAITNFMFADGTDIVISAKATDAFGNSNELVNAVYIVDISTPAPTIEIDLLVDGPEIGSNATLSITAEVGSAVIVNVIKDGTSYDVNVTIGDDGKGSLKLSDIDGLDLTDQSSITITATATDKAGNDASSIPTTYSVDAATTLPTISFNSKNGDPIGPKSILTIDRAEPRSEIELTIAQANGDDVTHILVANETGSWDIVLEDIAGLNFAHGSNLTFTFKVTDAVGNTQNSEATTYIVDAEAKINDLAFDNASGTSVAADASITGTAEAGATIDISVFQGSSSFKAFPFIVGADGTWSVKLDSVSGLVLEDGKTVTAQATITDKLGNTSQSTTATYTVDATTTAPTLVISESSEGKIAADATLSGTVTESGSTVSVDVTITQGNKDYTAKATIGTNQTWSLSLDSFTDLNLAHDDEITITVTQTDPVGNTASTAETTYIVDSSTDVPTLTFAATTPDTVKDVFGDGATIPFITGTAEAKATITLTFTDGTDTQTINDIQVDDQGNWKLLYQGLTADQKKIFGHGDTLTFSIIATDTVKNTAAGAQNYPYTVDFESNQLLNDSTLPTGETDIDYNHVTQDYHGPVNVDAADLTRSTTAVLTIFDDKIDFGLTDLKVYGRGGNDQFNLVSTSGDKSVTLHGDEGDDTLKVSGSKAGNLVLTDATATLNIESGKVYLSQVEEVKLGTGIDTITLTDFSSANILYDFKTGSLSGHDEISTINGAEKYYGSNAMLDIVSVHGDEIFVTGGSSTGDAVVVDTLSIEDHGRFEYREPNANNQDELDNSVTHIMQFEKIEISDFKFGIIEGVGTEMVTDHKADSGISRIFIDAGVNSGLVLDIFNFDIYNAPTAELKSGGAAAYDLTNNVILELSSGAITAAENTFVFDQVGAVNWSEIVWENGLNQS